MVDVSIVVLAAGKGTRLKLPYPKVLAPIMGKPMLYFVLNSIEEFILKSHIKAQLGIVTGHQSELVGQFLASYSASKPTISLKQAFQKEQKGTADAVKSYLDQIDGATSAPLTLIVCGDTPLLRPEIFQMMWDKLKSHPNLQAVASTFITKNPYGYGRILKSKDQNSFSIREEKDASVEEKLISEVNASLYLIRTPHVVKFITALKNDNVAKEYYLTDLFHPQFAASTLTFEKEEDFLGVNDQDQLEAVSNILKRRKISALRSEGVHFIDSATTYVDWEVKIGEGTIVQPGCVLQDQTSIGMNCQIGPYAVLKNTKVADGATIHAFTVSQDAMIGAQSEVGPLARLRPGTSLASHVKIGNFVEVKKSKIAEGSKVSHLSYVGDAIIGSNVNVGCGFITCNYDGKKKHQTQIGSGTFIGSDCQAVAPISIGSNCFVAAGTTLTENMPDGSFAIARNKQTTKHDMANRFLKSSKSDKVSS
jgi:bifunctional UDP-N-acetylglucosamine pyrophosphorylase/glucosamine-1-phosphate N-acetyltransferase